jgi:2-polyprenyl-3-methyl-5-hydroxy-6-metoxy-1,4-benzoquinol methylase
MTQRSVWKAAELETIRCDGCGSTDAQQVLQRPDGMTVVRCAQCDLHYLNPRPKPELISRLYEKDYYQNDHQASGTGYLDYLSEQARAQAVIFAEDKLRVLEPLWKPAGRRCLEIGCATGEFCQAISRRGAVPIGIDLSEFAIQEASKRYPQLSFRTATIESLKPGELYDDLFAFELIEHVLYPKDFLRRASELVKPGGLLALSTPNLDCGRSIGFASWTGFQTSFEHLYFFSRESLMRLAGESGFELTHWFTGYGDGLVPQLRPPSTKDRLKAAFASVGLLRLIQRMRRPFYVAPPAYVPEGRQHNLLAVFRKRSGTLAASK